MSPISLWSYQWHSGSKGPPPLLFIGGILIFISSIFFLILCPYVYDQHLLSTQGKVATGIVINKRMRQASDSGSSDTSYEVDYSFNTPDGTKVEGNDIMDPDAWDQINEGSSIQIEYVASKPRINQIGVTVSVLFGYLALVVVSLVWSSGATLAVKGLLRRSSAPVSEATTEATPCKVETELPSFLKERIGPATAFGTVLLFVGAIFLLIGIVDLRQERNFRTYGKTATAIVLIKSSHEEYDHQNNTRETHYELGYRFTTDDGKSVRGSEQVNWRTWRSIHERDPIQIVYLPQHPARNRLAADYPGKLLWVVTVLGTLLIAGGAILAGYGLIGTIRNRPKRTRINAPRRSRSP
jgi:hypothetical protein